MTLFNRANRLRIGYEFDKAAGIYEAIVADFPEEAEAYWGLVLCKYGIEYVDDPATAKKIPTCHRSSFDSVMDDGNFEQALENADATARKVYRAEAKQIEEIRKGIMDARISEAETDQNMQEHALADKYQLHIKQADARVIQLYAQALEKRETCYQESV